ncbi:MAG TPA: CAP domain-containing protein [Acidimicrobiales bacterium]|jgi:uncharacterized protein YkwD|nr:CAP domain-containing protein [Acidimicrobiales bacterium]
MRARRFIAAMASVATLAGGTLTLGVVLPGTALTAAPAAAATGSDEANLLALTNQARASVGDPALSMDSSLSSVARSWAQTMAAQGGISHNPDLGSQVDGWSRLGENVGVGASVAEVHQALLASPHHYENITGDFSLVGIGVASGGGRTYVVEDFEQPRGGGRSVAAADPGPPPTVARRVTTTVPPVPQPPRAAPPAVAPTPPPPPAPSVSTLHFVLDALRALDSLNSHS